MESGEFEKRIASKFEGKTTKVTPQVWGEIENNLNYGMYVRLSKRVIFYQRLAIACLLLLIGTGVYYGSRGLFSFTAGTHAISVNRKPFSEVMGGMSKPISFLSASFGNHFLNNSLEALVLIDVGREKLSSTDRTDPTLVAKNHDKTNHKLPFLTPLSPSIDLAVVQSELDVTPIYYPTILRKKSQDSFTNQYWAGLSVGSGVYDANYTGDLSNNNFAALSGASARINADNLEQETQMKKGISSSVSVDVGMMLNKNIALETGISYTALQNDGNLEQRILNQQIIESDEFDVLNTMIGEKSTNQIQIKNSFQMVAMPIKGGLFLSKKKLSLRVTTGFSLNYLISQRLLIANTAVDQEQVGQYNALTLDGLGGLEVGYTFLKKVRLTLEPMYRHSFSNSAFSPEQVIINTGLKYLL